MTSAMQRYMSYIFFADESLAKQDDPQADIFFLNISADAATPLDFGMDEKYHLEVETTGAKIQANTEWGALRALETFVSLVHWEPSTGIYSLNNLPLSIFDYPRFPWRGLLIDSSRHYLPVTTVLRVLDSMAVNKLNVLHWHLVDEQSFPLISLTYPLLSQKGSWYPSAVYTHDDIQAVINYANLRGIRVMPEFDTPGHTWSWKFGYPQLFPNCKNVRPVFDVTQTYTINFMTNFLQEMASLFGDSFVHLGGDEVNTDCWSQIPEIVQWMKDHEINSFGELQAYYEKVLEGITQSFGKSAVYWDEVFGQSDKYVLSNSSVINIWNEGLDEVTKVVKLGYRVVYSSPWYLDRQDPDGVEHYAWIDTWMDFYLAEPVDSNAGLTPSELERILGGEASAWGEAIDDNCIDERIWPRAAGFSERMWAPKTINNLYNAVDRMISFRCRMVRRGIRAGPIDPDYCATGQSGNQIPSWKPYF
jgi:hexosaminidase